MDYITKEPIKLDGKDVKVGSTVTLDDEVARGLIEVNAIEAVPTAADPVVPTDPAVREAAITDAVGKLDPKDADLWLRDGKPDAAALTALTGWTVTAAERNAVWEKIKPAA